MPGSKPRKTGAPAGGEPILYKQASMKVAIVNDSRAAAEVLRRILAEAAGFEVIWTAYSGDEAVHLALADRPDIVLMDLIMPGMDGAEATRQIMEKAPCVVLVVTATTIGNRSLVFEAMGYGALDAVNTPTLGPRGDMAGAEPLLQKLRTVARLVAPTHSDAPRASSPARTGARAAQDNLRLPIVAIGASTGGPQALAELISHLPEDFPGAVLIAQHVDHQFAPALVDWLQHHSALPVRLAREKDAIAARGVWVAGSGDHLVYGEDGLLRYTPHPRETPYRPSADALFASLAGPHRAMRVGVLLTGMGRDGAEGLLAMRNAGALTIAQDAATCVVYGMPKAAIEVKAASEVLPIAAIGPRIVEAVLSSVRSSSTLPARPG
jgi:two-component system, chemotaxis family, response regulator WspF